jgi:hypothetical protein
MYVTPAANARPLRVNIYLFIQGKPAIGLSLFQMNTAPDTRIQKLRKDTLLSIAALASSFQGLVQDASIDADDPLATSARKLQLDVHTMRIDQNARKLLCIIRAIKELKVTDNSHEGLRAEFAGTCASASESVRECLRQSYEELSALADEGFAVRQAASKFLR